MYQDTKVQMSHSKNEEIQAINSEFFSENILREFVHA